ncbi:MAG: radical SAM protein, partial [Symbiobacteriaceae bacterium]
MRELPRVDFNERPLIVIWEVTRACALACRHCRAEAIPRRDPNELTFEEGCRLIDQVKELDPPLFVLTGGDPFMRKDLPELIRYATSIGLRVSSSPSGTRLANLANMKRCAEAGLKRVAFSLDHADEEAHDAFRGVRG